MDKKSANGWYNSLEKWEGGLETEGVGPSGGPRETGEYRRSRSAAGWGTQMPHGTHEVCLESKTG